MTAVPELDGVVTRHEVLVTADHLASLQTAEGMIQWFARGHCDPWNHVEAAMALDVAGYHDEAMAAYEWLTATQRPDGSWHSYYHHDGSVKDDKLDTNVCAYVATGAWHHWTCTGDRGAAARLWPTVVGALEFVLAQRRADGLPLWAVEAHGRRWDYALLTGSASIQHALRCGARLGAVLGEPRPRWTDAADTIAEHVRLRPGAFEPKPRWAMDWYYPVLTGAMVGEEAKARLADGWETFAMEGLGIRCVSDEPWVTASETAECALAYVAIGDRSTATELLQWTRTHRRDDGAYVTGIVYPERIVFPFDERTSYTAAAVLLAVDAITGTTAGSTVFAPDM